MKLFPSKAFLVRQIGCSFLFVAVSAGMATSMLADMQSIQTPKAWFLLGCGILGVPFFGLVLVMGIKKMFEKQPFMDVDADGVSTTYGNYGRVSWQDLMEVRMAEFQTSATNKVTYLVLVPKNPDSFVSRYDAKTQKRAANALKQWGGIVIPMLGLGFKPEEIIGAIGEYGSQMILANAPPPPIIR